MKSKKAELTNLPGKRVLIPLPNYGFDPTEASVPWKVLTAKGHQVTFATPDGQAATADPRILTGQDLPSILKESLMADEGARVAYGQMENDPQYRAPLRYSQIRPEEFEGIFLPGGHDKAIRPYLESPELKQVIGSFFEANRPVGAVCHGTLLVGRSISHVTGKSVLWGRKTTGLTRWQELVAFYLTRWKLGDYYRTYPTLMADELISFLKSKDDYSPGPGFPIPMVRDSESNTRAGFTVLDGNYLSARWPGDIHKFSMDFVQLLSTAGAGLQMSVPKIRGHDKTPYSDHALPNNP